MREMLTREAEMFPGTEPPTLCKRQSRWAIIHTQAWAISQTQHTCTHVLFTIHAARLTVSHSASPEAVVILMHADPSMEKEQEVEDSQGFHQH